MNVDTILVSHEIAVLLQKETFMMITHMMSVYMILYTLFYTIYVQTTNT